MGKAERKGIKKKLFKLSLVWWKMYLKELSKKQLKNRSLLLNTIWDCKIYSVKISYNYKILEFFSN